MVDLQKTVVNMEIFQQIGLLVTLQSIMQFILIGLVLYMFLKRLRIW